MVQLNETLVELLDSEAERRGISRSALIREILTDNLTEARASLTDKQIVDGYTRMPPGTADDWGDLGGFTDAAFEELS